MSSYSAYGHTFKIDRPLNFVEEIIEESPDFTVLRSENLNFKHRKISPDIAEFYKEGVGKFRILNGTEIQYSLNSFEDENFEKSLLYLAIPIIFYQKGYLVMHASCVHINGQTIMFCGKKGSGKSTYCQHYLLKGGFISEDRCVINTSGNDQVTFNSQISIMKLKDTTKKNKNLILDKVPIEDDELGRSCYKLDRTVHNKSITDYKIDHCVFLNWGEELSLMDTDYENIFRNSFNNSLKSQNITLNTNAERDLINLNNFCSSKISFYSLLSKREDFQDTFKSSIKLLNKKIFEQEVQ